jgi:hypothetical protein
MKQEMIKPKMKENEILIVIMNELTEIRYFLNRIDEDNIMERKDKNYWRTKIING